MAVEPLATSRARRSLLALVALSLLALLAIVAFATRSGFTGDSDAAPSQTFVDYAFTVFFILFVIAIPFAMYAYFVQGRELAASGGFKRRPVLQTVAFVVGFALIAFIVRWFYDHPRHGFLGGLRSPLGDAARKAGKHGRHTPVEPHFEWPAVIPFALLALALLVAFLVLRSRRQARERIPLEQPEVKLELADAINDAIDDLEAEPDARRAVIAAYARMERVLGRHGLPRRPSETPWEYLGRVLIDLRARAESVRRLTSLFERAKFSHHEVDLRMKLEAVAALGAIRDELREAAA